MYTGIIECTGTLASAARRSRGLAIRVATPPAFRVQERVGIGDSVALSGVCVTATAIDGGGFAADISAETLELTCFRFYRPGQLLNLELPCTPGTHLGGHIVQGHVDGIGEIVALQELGEAMNVQVRAPRELLRYIALKGSSTVDGASLTVNALEDDRFRLTLIPHTMQTLAFSCWRTGWQVNLEVDVLARYLERLLGLDRDGAAAGGGITYQKLIENGF